MTRLDRTLRWVWLINGIALLLLLVACTVRLRGRRGFRGCRWVFLGHVALAIENAGDESPALVGTDQLADYADSITTARL